MPVTVSQARDQLLLLIEQVNRDMRPVVITSKAGNAVLISQSEYKSIVETAYLLSTSTNRDRLFDSLSQADRGELFALELPIETVKSAPKATKKRR